jgi:hypothetical protein
MSDTTESTDGFVPVDAIYAGRRETTAGKLMIVFYLVAQPTESAIFSSPKFMRRFRTAPIGGVYTHLRNGDTFRLSDRLVRSSKDERIAGWQSADDTVDVTIRARKRIAEERTKGKANMMLALEPFRAEYARTDYVGRLAMEVVLLTALRRPLS